MSDEHIHNVLILVAFDLSFFILEVIKYPNLDFLIGVAAILTNMYYKYQSVFWLNGSVSWFSIF